ncbi:J domain-containing protein [Calothrix sp. PCC 6303]|uniref:J domain-containing protein n=1 Tax=Calothrix sp. PCC 6303 TaxID=1170562 RepID=UPI0002A01907|nr:J domain-containing protein [Calothrix sp. PCC 6303]AFZ03784.1 heat shock protein DnaJ domain protein [Calothrix sp. PCC 6303]
MADSNHYETLKVNPNASQAEIKQAYRRLVKLFHPDLNQETTDPDQIIRINAAYEVLGDEKNRHNYDQRFRFSNASSQGRKVPTRQQYQPKRQTGREIDELVEEWMSLIYHPVNRTISRILESLDEQIDDLAADPFDDDLLGAFQDYLESCREELKQAQNKFRSLPNPPSLARTAAHLYYSLSQIGDGLDELKYFPLSYDENYLHTGQEMFRIATQLHHEAQDSAVVYR